MTTECLICGKSTGPIGIGGSRFLECVACGYGLLDRARPAPEYWSETHGSEISDYWVRAKSSYFRSALSLLERKTQGRRLLDVGGGLGFFCELALERGWDAYSLDISSRATALAVERLGEERALSDFSEVDNASFDVATMWCVVAHTLDPHALVSHVRARLSPGGLLWLTTPNFRFQKPYARLRSSIARPIDFIAEDHVGHFTWSAINELLRRNRFVGASQHMVGITETCIAASSDARPFLAAKRIYNELAFRFARGGIGNYVSELQVTAEVDH